MQPTDCKIASNEYNRIYPPTLLPKLNLCRRSRGVLIVVIVLYITCWIWRFVRMACCRPDMDKTHRKIYNNFPWSQSSSLTAVASSTMFRTTPKHLPLRARLNGQGSRNTLCVAGIAASKPSVSVTSALLDVTVCWIQRCLKNTAQLCHHGVLKHATNCLAETLRVRQVTAVGAPPARWLRSWCPER